MITGRDAGKEARRLDDLAVAKDGDDLQVSLLRGVVKGLAVAIKVLVTIRSNQVTALVKKYGKDVLRTPEDRTDNAKSDSKDEEK